MSKKTPDYSLFEKSFPNQSLDHFTLVFQGYPITKSDGQPQIVVWNKDSDWFRVIAENG